jgi:hypothetical protein
LPDLAQACTISSPACSSITAGTISLRTAPSSKPPSANAVDDETAGPRLAALAGAAQHSGLELWGQSLTTAPRGYAVDHARIELLRRKSLALGATRPCPDGVARDDALGFVADTWRAAAPVTAWLDAHVGPSTLELDRGRRRR